jgi:hypothetical protein
VTQPSARVIADSISPTGVRLTTIECTFHRFELPSFNTYRVWSRNSASSRAVPLKKTIKRVQEDPALPLWWGANQPGMQAHAELTGGRLRAAQGVWWAARQFAVLSAKALGRLGLHKQLANRLLEPFMWHTAIVTATEWQNFFDQRCHVDAQPEIRAVAEAMREALNSGSVPTRELRRGDWHTPYVHTSEPVYWDGIGEPPPELKYSVARCARVSTLNHDGKVDPEADLRLYNRLVTADPMHASPLEHVASPAYGGYSSTLGNFKGWEQLRHIVEAQRIVGSDPTLLYR